MLESFMWTKFRRITNLYVERVETRSLGGFPDAVYTDTHGGSGMIEGKVGAVRQDGRIVVKLEKGQWAWHQRWARHGGNSWWLIGTEEEVILVEGAKMGKRGVVPPGEVRYRGPWDARTGEGVDRHLSLGVAPF